MLFLIRKKPSSSAKLLCTTLGIRRNRLTKPVVVVPKRVTHVINWGSSSEYQFKTTTTALASKLLNAPSSVAKAVNKLTAFQVWKEAGLSVPTFWTDSASVTRTGNDVVLCRTKLSASKGDGIVITRAGEPLVNAPLYVKYLRKKAEYRMHVVGGKVIFTQQKKRKADVEETADDDQLLIRNHANGWVFAINNISFTSEEERVTSERLAVDAVASLGLDFGAVDLLVTKSVIRPTPVLLEVNTAPGIESPTLLEAYVKAFKGLINNDHHPH